MPRLSSLAPTADTWRPMPARRPLPARRHAGPSGVLRHGLVAGIVVCVALTACTGSSTSSTEFISSPQPPAVPLPTAQPLLPPLPPVEPAVGADSADAPAATTAVPEPTSGELSEGSAPFDDETAVYSAWQFNLVFERDLRNAIAVVEILFDDDGSQVATELALADIRAYAAEDPALLELVNEIAADVAGQAEGGDVLGFELVTRAFPDEARQVPAPADRPADVELAQLVADGNARLDPLKPTFFRLLQATVALATGQIAAPEGTPAALLVEELRAEAEAVYGPVLVEPLAELGRAIPSGAAFDSAEAQRSFGRFAVELVERVGGPALGE